MAMTAKRMGRPPGEPTRVVRLPVPVAALAKRLASGTLRAETSCLSRCRPSAGRHGAADGLASAVRLSLAG